MNERNKRQAEIIHILLFISLSKLPPKLSMFTSATREVMKRCNLGDRKQSSDMTSCYASAFINTAQTASASLIAWKMRTCHIVSLPGEINPVNVGISCVATKRL